MKITITGLKIDTQEKLERMRAFSNGLNKLVEEHYWQMVDGLWDGTDCRNLTFDLRYKFDRIISKEWRDKMLKESLKKAKKIPTKK